MALSFGPDLMSKLQALDIGSHKLIIGVDYGTTYSGVSYVTSSQGGDIDDVNVIKTWPRGGNRDVAGVWKAPTRIAYQMENPTLAKNQWGFGINEQVKSYSWTKLLLDKKTKPTRFDDRALISATGQGVLEVPSHRDASGVCEDYLRELYNFAVEKFKREMTDQTFNKTPMECWITMPAIWSDQAKNATLLAAKNAGFGSRLMDKVNWIPEPEAAAIAVLHKHTQPKANDPVKEGETILICDCGGGTVDLTTYTVILTSPKLEFRELCVGIGGKCGSSYIDRHFHNLMTERFGTAFTSLAPRTKGPGSRFMRGFEDAKADFGSSEQMDPREVPIVMRLAKNSEYYDSENYSIWLSHEDMEGIFRPVVNEVLELISQQITTAKNEKNAKINRIVLVGGFGDSPYLYKAIKKRFEEAGSTRVMCPPEPQAAVVRGAALCGLLNLAPKSRQCRKNYGFSCSEDFRPSIDQRIYSLTSPFDGRQLCSNRVRWLIYRGQEIVDGYSRPHDICRDYIDGDPRTAVTMLYSYPSDGKPDYYTSPGVEREGEIQENFANIDLRNCPVAYNSSKGKRVYKINYQIEVRFGDRDKSLRFRCVQDGREIGTATIAYDKQ